MRTITAKQNVIDHDEHDNNEPAIIALAGQTYTLDSYDMYTGEDGGKYKWGVDDFTLNTDVE